MRWEHLFLLPDELPQRTAHSRPRRICYSASVERHPIFQLHETPTVGVLRKQASPRICVQKTGGDEGRAGIDIGPVPSPHRGRYASQRNACRHSLRLGPVRPETAVPCVRTLSREEKRAGGVRTRAVPLPGVDALYCSALYSCYSIAHLLPRMPYFLTLRLRMTLCAYSGSPSVCARAAAAPRFRPQPRRPHRRRHEVTAARE